MLHRWNLAALSVIVLCSTTIPAAAQTGTALLRIQGDWQSTETGRSLSQKFHFANEAVSFGLSYDISVPDDLPPGKCTSRWWAWTTGYVTLGMPSPIQANWYTQAFSAIQVDGVSLHDIPADWHTVRHSGSDVLAEGTWQTPSGPVVMRLLLRAGDDKLLMQVALPPENTGKRLDVRLMAYPQGFPEPRRRRAATIADEYEAGRRIDLLDLAQPWILLYDQLYDRDRRGGGPCGMVWVPDELQSAVTNLGSYGVTTTLRAKPDSRVITVGLWDFTWNRDVATVRRLLRDAGRTVSADLRHVAAADWHQGVPAVELTERYRQQLNQLAQARRQPTAFDQMTREIDTPHVRWARPLKDGPVRTLVVGPRWNQRETVELAQRLDMDYRTVSFSSDDALIDPQELYLYDSYEVYGFAKKNETDILFALARELDADPDCLILTGFRPRILPQETRTDIVERVRAGSGLLLLGHARGLLKDFADNGDLKPSAWQPQVVPLDKLPGIAPIVQQRRPVCTAYTFGRGRVLVFHYNTGRRLGLTPGLSHEDPDVLGYYDYYHSLVADSVLWAAGREPLARVQIDDQGETLLIDARVAVHGATVEIMVHDPHRKIRERRRLDGTYDFAEGSNRLTFPSLGPATGERFVSVWLEQDEHVVGWGTAYSNHGVDQPHIADIEIPEPILEPNSTLEGTIQLSALSSDARLDIELRDARDRLLAHCEVRPTATEVPLQLAACHPLTILHELRVRLYDGDRLLDQRLADITRRKGRISQPAGAPIDDFFFLVWSGGENHAIRHHINRILSEGGVDWIDNTGLTGGDAFKAQVYCRNAARYNLASVPYITRIASMQESGRERKPCLHDAAHVASWSEGLKQRALGAAPYGPPAYTLGDENFLVRKKLDVCIAPHSLAAFRKALRQQYGHLSQLNETWQSDYDDWGEIVPPTFDEVKDDPARWPRWADHRLFMDRTLSEAHAVGREAIRSADPDARVGFDGVFSLDSWHGYDFYGLCQACDLLQVYAQRHEQIEYLRSWQRPEAVVGAWYNRIGNRDETSAKRLAWHLLFHDFNSSWYWTSFNTGPALLFPDLRTAPQFLWMQESIEEIKGGIGKLLLNAHRQHDRIAVYYSQPSVHAGTLMNRGHAAAQWGFARLVEDLQLQYDMISYDQVRQGTLKDYQVLLMPACPAISPEEADAIRQFVEGGGMVIADTLPAVLDDHCRLLQTGQLDDMFGVRRSGLPKRGSQPIRIAQQELPLDIFDSDLQPAGAQARGSAADAPAVLIRGCGQGYAVLLNTAIETYESLHFSRTAEPVASVMRELLDLGGIRPQASVYHDGQRVRDCEVVRYNDGGIRYLALVRDNHIPGLQPQEVTIELPHAAHVYDMRTRTPFGHTASIQTRLSPGDPKVLALLPYKVQGISIAPVRTQVVPGALAEFDAALDLGGRAPAGSHCLRIEVLSPDGEPVGHYAQNVLCETSSASISVPLALNDPPGTWTIRATDVASGQSATTSFSIKGIDAAGGAGIGE